MEQTPGAHLIYDVRKHHISVFVFQERSLPARLSDSASLPGKLSFDMELGVRAAFAILCATAADASIVLRDCLKPRHRLDNRQLMTHATWPSACRLALYLFSFPKLRFSPWEFLLDGQPGSTHFLFLSRRFFVAVGMISGQRMRITTGLLTFKPQLIGPRL